MTCVTLSCPACGYTARRPLGRMAGCRGVSEGVSESAICPAGHGYLVREDGGQIFDQLLAAQ